MANDLWRTPPEVFSWAARQYPLVADLACDENNKLCSVGLTESLDSLGVPWAELLAQLGGWGWLNPPYSDPLPWVTKVLEEQKRGAGVVMLLNADHSVRWFARALTGLNRVVYFIANDLPKPDYRIGRIAFLDANGQPVNSNNKPQFMLVFHPYGHGGLVTDYVPLEDIMTCEHNT